MTHEYDDIIHLPHLVSKHYPPMPMSERAAQFSSFAAVANPNDITRFADDNEYIDEILEEDLRNYIVCQP